MQPDKRSFKREATPTPLQNPITKSAKIRRLYALFGIAVIATVVWGVALKFALPLLIPTSSPAAAGTSANLSEPATPQIIEPDYQAYELDNATVHVVTLAARTRLSIAVASELATVAAFAQQENALVAINGGFFDPQNGKTISHLMSQGQTVGDPADNERLTGNLELAPYMDKIFNRSEFRVYDCQTDGPFVERAHSITFHDSSIPEGCVIDTVLGAGPQLLPADTAFEEGFTDYADGELIRDAIGSRGPNARSAIGMIGSTEEIVLLMAAQRADAPGLTLAEMASFAETLGVTSLLNLDGGSSSTLFYSGQTYTARRDADGMPIERPVKSVVMVK